MTGSPARALLAAVRFYQRAVSPVFPPRCRFEPTCSAYAAEAIELHGAGRGGWLTVRRLAKCAPWNPGGVDLVPPRTDTAAHPAGCTPGPSGTAGPTHSSCTPVPDPVLTPEPGTDDVRRPHGATPPAQRRSAQQEAGVA